MSAASLVAMLFDTKFGRLERGDRRLLASTNTTGVSASVTCMHATHLPFPEKTRHVRAIADVLVPLDLAEQRFLTSDV